MAYYAKMKVPLHLRFSATIIVLYNVKLAAVKKGLTANFIKGFVFKNCSSITVPSSVGNAINSYDADFTGIDPVTGASTSCSPTAVHYVKAPRSVYCFPNPVKGDHFTVNDDNGINKVRVYNLQETEVSEINGNAMNKININVRGLPSGFYIVNVLSSKGEVHSLQLIKQ